MQVAAVILAAGASSRMGRPKHLLRLPCGRTMPRRAADAAAEAGASRTVIVLGQDADRVGASLGDARCVVNTDWHEGLGGSIACGVNAVLASEPDAILLLLADQPRVDAEALRQLEHAAMESTSGAAAASYANTIGVPACFDRRHFNALRNLPAAAGAKRLLQSIKGLAVIEMPTAAMDVDTPGDAKEMNMTTVEKPMVPVLLFGPQALIAERKTINVPLATDAKASDVLAALAEAEPRLAGSIGKSRLAINQVFATHDDPVSPGDEVALIGMVSGG